MDRYANNSLDKSVQALIRQPTENLEERIDLIRSWIRSRAALRDSSLSKLHTSRSVAIDTIYRLRYDEFSNPNNKLILSLRAQSSELERAIIKEEWQSWSDTKLLQDSLQQATEELNFERSRLKLVEGGDKKTTTIKYDSRERN